MRGTLTFRTDIQAALFEHEIKGQLSDGNWENAKPNNHWKPWCDCKVLVDRVGRVGRTFNVRKDNYALTSRELLSVIGGRMIGYARLALAYGYEAVAEFECLVDCDGWVGVPTNENHAGNTYWSDKRAAITASLAKRGLTLLDVRGVVTSPSSYTMDNLLRDLREMKKVMRTYIPAVAFQERVEAAPAPSLRSELRAAGMVI
jgi:hypothetical protein